MGFFSDLKEDLNQAVNELMPEDELEAAPVSDELSEGNDTEMQPESTITPEDLSNMLDMVEAIGEQNELDMADVEMPQQEIATEAFESEIQETEMFETVMPEEEVPETDVLEPEISDVESQEMEMEVSDMEITAESEVDTQLPEDELTEEAILEPIAEDDEPLQENEGEEYIMEDIMNIESKEVSDETAVVTEGMSITGDIISSGSLELIGNVVGNIEILGKLNITGSIQGNSKAAEIYAEGARINGEVTSQGSVKIGQSSVVIGNITANSAVIAGAVKGDIDVHGPVILDTSAIVMGNIKSKSVQINNGAVIEGMCSQCYAEVNPTSFFEEINKKSKKKEK